MRSLGAAALVAVAYLARRPHRLHRRRGPRLV